MFETFKEEMKNSVKKIKKKTNKQKIGGNEKIP